MDSQEIGVHEIAWHIEDLKGLLPTPTVNLQYPLDGVVVINLIAELVGPGGPPSMRSQFFGPSLATIGGMPANPFQPR